MKRFGYRLMQVALIMIIAGGVGDIAYSFSVETMIPAHIDYLGIAEADVSPRLKALTLGFMRGLGGFIIATGVGALCLLKNLEDDRALPLWGALIMVTVGEGNNALQMFLLDSPFYLAPLCFVILFWGGAVLWLFKR